LKDHPLIGDAETFGLLGALLLVKDKAKGLDRIQAFGPEADIGMVCRGHCFDQGLVMRAVGDRMVVSPPLVITRAQIDDLTTLARRCLDLTLADAQRHGWMN
jgi:putrescine aminotransferase